MTAPVSPFTSLLVVEDNEDRRRILVDTLMLAGFEVRAASHGAEALRLLDRYTPDLILLDLVLPWVNGLEVLATLREKPALRRVPVLVTTGTLTTEFDLQAFQPVKVMRKPLNFAAPVPTIRLLLAECSGPAAPQRELRYRDRRNGPRATLRRGPPTFRGSRTAICSRP